MSAEKPTADELPEVPATAAEPPKFNGAHYLKHTQLINRRGEYDPHWAGMVTKSGKHIDLENRDIGQAFPFLMKESLLATNELCYKDNAAASIALDTIGQFMSKIWNESLQDNLSGLCQFRDLYKAMEEIPGGKDVYANWSTFFVQTFFAYMFTVRKMSNGLPADACHTDVKDYQAMLIALDVLDDDLKKAVVRQWLERGQWPSNMAYGKLIRRLEDFLEVVKEGQRMRLAHEAKIYRAKHKEALPVRQTVSEKLAKQLGVPQDEVHAHIKTLPQWLQEEIETGLLEMKPLSETGKTMPEVAAYFVQKSETEVADA